MAKGVQNPGLETWYLDSVLEWSCRLQIKMFVSPIWDNWSFLKIDEIFLKLMIKKDESFSVLQYWKSWKSKFNWTSQTKIHANRYVLDSNILQNTKAQTEIADSYGWLALIYLVTLRPTQLTQASFLQKSQMLQNVFLISVTLRWHTPCWSPLVFWNIQCHWIIFPFQNFQFENMKIPFQF